MQNNSTGMLATSVPVGVVPSAPRWPSWNIHTSAPNAAVSDKTLSTNAFSGRTTLPVSRNSSTNVIAAITPSTSGSRDVIACELSRLICAIPVTCTGFPPGGLTACNASSWASEASVNSGAVLPMVRNALPSFIPVAAEGGPARLPSTNVPVGADTDDTSATRDSRRGVLVQFGRRNAGGVRDDDGDVGRRVDGEIVAKLVADLTCRQGLRQHAVVREAPFDAQERRAEQKEQSDDGQADRNRPAHDEFRGSIPEHLLDGLAFGLGSTEQPAEQPAGVQ